MSVFLPKKLPTSVGIELSYMPAMMEELHNELASEGFKVWQDSDYVYAPFMRAMQFRLDKFKIKVFKCSTDPGCVEVPTLPYKTANALRTAIRKITATARGVGLLPTSSYSIGGGAHIHTGTLGSTSKEQTIYKALMTAWHGRNPWFAWAFAGANDFSNAQAVSTTQVLSNVKETPEALRRRIKRIESDIKMLQDDLITETEELHTERNWTATWRREDKESDVWRYTRYMIQNKRELMDYRRQLAALLDTSSHPSLVHYTKINTDLPKSYVVAHRGHTVEFRCFRMAATNKGMDYLVAAACGVVTQCRDEMRLMVELGVDEVDTRGVMSECELIAMKYSEAKRGFNAMLRSLDLEPSDYREYCVNMALRMRYRRKTGVYKA